jgi:hypothetical protein
MLQTVIMYAKLRGSVFMTAHEVHIDFQPQTGGGILGSNI